MVKEKRILSYFIGWLILGLFICFVGISNTYALVIDGKFQGQAVNTNIGIQANSYIQNNSYITVDESNALNYYVAEICTTNNVFNISNISSNSGNVSYSRSITNIKSCNTTNYTGTLAKIYFKVNQWADAGNGNFGIIFNFRLNSNVSYYTDIRIMNIYTTNEIDETSELINNQTNELNNSINNSTNTITGSIDDAENNINSNINDMEQSIVDSNKETQDVIKDQFNSCRDSYNLFDKNSVEKGYFYNSTGEIMTSGNWGIIQVKVKPNTNYFYLTGNNYNNTAAWHILLDENKNFIKTVGTYKNVHLITTTENTAYIGLSVALYSDSNDLNTIMLNEGSTAKSYEPYGEKICTNKIDDTNDKLEGIQGALTDSSSPDTGSLENSAGWLPAGPLDSILNLPLTMLNSLTNSLSKTCAPLNLTLPYVRKNIQIPCLSAIFAQITGVNELWTWVGTIASVLILYNYLLNLYAWVDRVLTLRAEFDEAMGADLANWGRL